MAATSEIEICNLALLRLGQREINSLNESSNEASFCKRLYERVRVTVLTDHPWRFACKVQALSLIDAESPIWDYVYARPYDMLRAIDMPRKQAMQYGSEQIKYEIIGNTIHTNQADASLRYIYDIRDPNLFDSQFIDAFAWRLASDLAMPVTQRSEAQGAMLQGYRIALQSAMGVSASESRLDPIESTNLADSRRR